MFPWWRGGRRPVAPPAAPRQAPMPELDAVRQRRVTQSAQTDGVADELARLKAEARLDEWGREPHGGT